MAFDPHGLLVYSTIQSGGVIGSTSGTTLQVYPGDSSKFSVNQNITVWPPGIDPNIGTAGIDRNAEIMRVVTIDTQSDTLTVQRAQEGSTPALSTIAAGWQVANTISPKVMTDIENYITGNSVQNNLVTNYTNAGTAGGNFSYMNLGGVKLLWGLTAAENSGSPGNSDTLTLPSGFFSTIQSINLTPTNLTAVTQQQANVNSFTTSSISIYFISSGSGTQQVSVFVVGT